MKAEGGSKPLEWFNLFPRKLGDDGWWYYKGKNPQKQTEGKLSLHSSGKEGSKIEGFEITDAICWAKMHEVIRLAELVDKIEADKNIKSHFRDSFEVIKIVGYLKVVDE